MTGDLCPGGATQAQARTSGAQFAMKCALNVYTAVERTAPEGRALNRWMRLGAETLRVPRGMDFCDDADRRDSDYYLPTPEAWRDIGRALHEAAACAAPTGDGAVAWIEMLNRKLQLGALSSQILALTLHYEQDDDVARLYDTISYYRRKDSTGLRRDARQIARLLGVTAAEVVRCLARTAPLLESGLLWIDHSGGITLCKHLSLLLEVGAAPGSDLGAQLLGAAGPTHLSWKSFAHLMPEAEIAALILRAALAREERGINILLYGPPGTGKTSLAATLAAHVDAKLCAVAETDQHGGEPSRGERLAGLRLAQCLTSQGNALLLFDEAEDLLCETDDCFGPTAKPSRAFMHRLLEQNRVPIIWTANEIRKLGPAVLRRMTMCLELRIPDIAARATLWCDMARTEKLPLARQEAARLALLVPAAPAVAATALRAARLAGGDANTAHIIVEGIARAVHGGFLPAPGLPDDACYTPSLINADCDLAALAENLCRPDSPRQVSFLLSGPPGTGKSAWVRHLARKMGLPVLCKRASDLLGSFVGETEKQIAAAFAEARATRAFLIFDEADSLLFDRSYATHSWEVSQANEMLTWMSEHSYPFACTTNVVERMDAASVRRFLFKIRLGWLNASQTRSAFQIFFGVPAPVELGKLTTLAPADFALVLRRARVQGVSADAQALLRLLAAECRGRVASANRIGFTPRQDES
jgi:AAA+ superfamily predicted ATPase